MPPHISIIIPTCRRPRSLHTALLSAIRQEGVDASALELVVVDNDRTDSARAVVNETRIQAPFPLAYVHEPEPGVASARNAAMAAAKGELIAFLDDDEEAPPTWLANLLSVQRAFDADVVFGPVIGRAPPQSGVHRPYLEDFFSRKGPASTGPTNQYYGCGNSLLRRSALPDPLRPFDPSRNHTGGEDDLLFGQMHGRGARFAWAADAPVWEDPLPERLSLDYTLRRAFAYGQGGSIRKVRATPLDWRGLAFSMTTGLGQALVFGALSAIKWATRAPDRAFMFDRAARGLGKVLWWRMFHTHFYGSGLRTRAAAEQTA